MKKAFVLLVLFVSSVYSAMDEHKTDVYFGNGISTDRQTAKKNAENILKDAIIEKFGLDYYNQHIGKVDYAYNSTHLWGFGDIIESALQKLDVQSLVDVFARWKASFNATH